MQTNRVLLCLLLGILNQALFFTTAVFAGAREVELEPIVIKSESLQEADIITTKDISRVDINKKPAASLDDALNYDASIDVSRRSICGVQSDLSIRGSTPEQAAVSINGIIVNDPQTAHHNLDIGLPSSNIERVDVTKGPAPTPWGQGTMGGAVNIVTKKPTRNEGDISFFYGDDRTQKSSVYVAHNKDKLGFSISADEATSDGWRYDTDFKEFSLASSGLVEAGDCVSSYILLGYGEKEFGASGFYGPYDSKEWTNSLFSNWDVSIKKEKFNITPRAYFKRHHDKYMLDINRPNYYLNHHTTDTKGVMLEAEADTGAAGQLFAGADINRESIQSSRLGKHSRNRNSFYLNLRNYSETPLGYDISLKINDYSKYRTELLPQAGISFMLGPGIRLRSSAAKSSRQPSYTELYYDSPSDKGNNGLSQEKALNYEAGVDVFYGKNKDIRLSCTSFRRESSDLIDWVKEAKGEAYYQAKNITKVNTEGFESELSIKFLRWLNLKGSYTYIDSDIKKDRDYISKYAFNHPAHKVTADADIILPFGTQNITLLYKDRRRYSHYLIMGCSLSYQFLKCGSIFVNIDNIFNSAYEDIKDNRLPGRKIGAGLRIRF